jgi:hypothetical protein
MSQINVTHKECGGLLMEVDEIHLDHPPGFLTGKEFSITCLTCLQEVTDPAELSISEFLAQ